MKYQRDRAWMEVDLDILGDNWRTIRQNIQPGAEIVVVVKANAYGLGAVPIARELERLGCRNFGVACIEEAMELREAGVGGHVLILGVIPEEYIELMFQWDFSVPVSSLSQAEYYSRLAQRYGQTLKTHVAADVGMSRFGLVLDGQMEQAVAEALAMARLPGLAWQGVMTHFTGMENPWEREFDDHQIGLFLTFCDRLDAAGLKLPRHCSCSAITQLHPECHLDMIRVSALPFGLQPTLYRGFSTRQMFALRARIWHIKEVPLGTPVGYGPLAYTRRRTRIAVIPYGFGDGIHRIIGNRCKMLVHGKRARQIGKLCMDYCMLDITDIPEAKVWDIGQDGEENISVFEMADLYPGSPCEVSSSIGARTPRLYLKGGELVEDGAE